MTMQAVPLEQLAALGFSGKEQRSFLQGQLTQDLLRLDSATSLLTGWCNPAGRLLATGQIFDWQSQTIWLLPAELAEPTITRLRMFVLRADVQIQRLELQVHGLLGFDAEQAIAGMQLSTRSVTFSADGNSALLAVAGSTRRALLLSRQPVDRSLPDEVGVATATDWFLADIRDGLPVIHTATAEAFVPQQANLDLLDGISFSKGCYVGQEVVARTQHLGRIKRRMYRYASNSGVEPGHSLVDSDGRAAGKVVSCAPAETGFELLAVVPIDKATTPLFTQSGSARLSKLPLPYRIPAIGD